jgi:polar amino acid transport system substrate-binding protein
MLLILKRIIAIWIILLSVTAIANDKIVTISVSEYPPFEYTGEDGNITGIDVDTITEVFKRAGYKVEFTMVPWLRALDLVTKGKVDATASIKHSSSHDAMLMPSDPISYTNNFFFKKKNLKIEPKNIYDLKLYSVGIIAGYPYGKKFDQVNFNTETISSREQVIGNLKKLSAGRIDLFACELPSCKYFINKYPDKFSEIDYIESLSIDDVSSYYLGFSKKDPIKSEKLLKIFNAELKKYIAEGNYIEGAY